MKQFKVGLQLYSVRGDMEKDFYGTLKAVKEAGYDYVEFAGYYGHTAEEVRGMLDELGLTCISVHQGPDLFINKGQEAVDYLTTIGAKYCAIPWYGIENYENGNFDATIA
ncbi:MAG: sugar phosphate isomerase/epimerase, partial [Oscillospiraceae bacterium]|nr:sugar phosphate isomerase/epimerase [Oscillospiraceae bacterium]